MRKLLAFLLLFTLTQTVFSFNEIEFFQVENDSIIYNKNTDFEEKRVFNDDLSEKYNDKEFKYIDDIEEPEPKKEEPTSTPNLGFFNALGGFMSYIFPVLLGVIVVIIILKLVLGNDTGFWNFKNNTKKVAEKLVYEDEDIHESDFDRLLKQAIANKDYRLATRYYYLALLKKLSDKKTIEYHKDKTNTEYLFEIKNKTLRNQFSEVSYIYTYVWYGEFPIDAQSFNTVEQKYQSIYNLVN